MRIRMVRGYCVHRVVAYERKLVRVMAINSAGPRPGPEADDSSTNSTPHLSSVLPSVVVEALAPLSLRCVECSALYPALEIGRPPRYRCECGGVLDVEFQPRLTRSSAQLDTAPLGPALRHLFEQRAAAPLS